LLKRFNNKVVLLTGGTSGIGLGIANAFANQGARVIATGATRAEVDQVKSMNSGIDFKQLDVSTSENIQNFFEKIDTLDVLINCAGIIKRELEHDPEVFQEVINVNLNGTMRACSAARHFLKETNGSIINIASMLTFFGGGLVPAYSASKGGIAQLTKSLAIAYASDQIRVNAIAPGWIKTPLTTALQEDKNRANAILSRTPMNRWGEPEDLAGPAMFLASDDAKFVTGSIIPVDGGYMIT
jgi:NAD(P)-dependent dehydrogenase (short-subunit alcohol dehydrogenase family)